MNALRASLSKTYNCALQQCEIDLGDSLCLLHDNSFISLANDDSRDPICPLPPNSSASSPGDRKIDSGYASRRERPLSFFDLRPRDSAQESPLAKSPSLPREKYMFSGDGESFTQEFLRSAMASSSLPDCSRDSRSTSQRSNRTVLAICRLFGMHGSQAEN
jgi:hypothetical protein